MHQYRDYLDELFIDKLGFEPDFQFLTKPIMDGSDNLIALSRDYLHGNVSVIVAECNDRLPVFQKQLINEYKKTYPDAHFLFISNAGKVFDLYNYSNSKKLKAITYNEIERNTKLFKEKIQFFNASNTDGSADLKVQIEKAFETTDKITRKFYDNFKVIHEKLTKAIKGIADEHDKKWYATTLLNRIMFIFFLQKNHVLQDDTDFLITKFNEVKKKKKDYFTEFLLPLFFKGFAKKDSDADKKEFVAEYGHVKYLNGGLFYPNKIELKYATINIEKLAGIKVTIPDGTKPQITISAGVLNEVITFLNEYTWYLDNRPTKDEKEINPDVLGYIFEKYINQKELGAYYTKEDITEYISKNTIISFIFDKLRHNGFEAPDPTPIITDNGDIISIADAFIANCNDYKTVKFLYKDILQPLSVLDPSVGSGAFLFAALNILLPIYQATIAQLKSFKGKVKDEWLVALLQNLSGHPEEYFLTKQIILNNLYGVDIVEEGVEICKLRLFLQLASHLADITAIEPLPDIDFNIYAGNSLVGGLSWEDLQGNYAMGLFTKDSKKLDHEILLKDIDALKNEKKQYKLMQGDENADEKKLKKQKEKIQFYENKINNAIDIGIENPFHWFVEYAEIIERGGFDVIIGNPPYVEYTKKNKEGRKISDLYKLNGYTTIDCNNLYVFFIERILKICQRNSYWSFIVPLSISSAQKMAGARNLINNSSRSVWTSHFAWRPSKLFDGANMLLSILISQGKRQKETNNDCKLFTTRFYKWYTEEREALFPSITYVEVPKSLIKNKFPKIPNEIAISILNKIESNKRNVSEHCSLYITDYYINYFRAVLYWVKILDHNPIMRIDDVETSTGEMKQFYFNNAETRNIIGAVLSSTTFFLHYMIYSSCQVINSDDFNFRFDIGTLNPNLKKQLNELGKKLFKDFKKNSEVKTRFYKTGFKQEKEQYKIRLSKPIIDEIDTVLSKHYLFTKEELSLIINYDLRYRMGGDDEEE